MYRIVVVEDEMIVRQGIVLTTDWASVDCEVVGEARNGQEGLELILKLRPEIVISDIKMPLKNGLEMAYEILEVYSPSIIFLTAFSEFEYVKEALSLGAVDYIVKPFKDGELISVLQRAKEQVNHQKLIEQIHQTSLPKRRKYDKFFSLSVKSKHHNILKAIEIIRSDFNKDISVETVADELNVSRSYLSDLFKRETTYTFHEYLVKTRLMEACKLLQDSDYRIYEIASMVGYRDQRYFSTAFKKHLGVTPQQFKEEVDK